MEQDDANASLPPVAFRALKLPDDVLKTRQKSQSGGKMRRNWEHASYMPYRRDREKKGFSFTPYDFYTILMHDSKQCKPVLAYHSFSWTKSFPAASSSGSSLKAQEFVLLPSSEATVSDSVTVMPTRTTVDQNLVDDPEVKLIDAVSRGIGKLDVS